MASTSSIKLQNDKEQYLVLNATPKVQSTRRHIQFLSASPKLCFPIDFSFISIVWNAKIPWRCILNEFWTETMQQECMLRSFILYSKVDNDVGMLLQTFTQSNE